MTIGDEGYGGTVPPVLYDDPPAATEIDYDRIISGVTERVTEALRPAPQTSSAPEGSPYVKLEELRYSDPAGYDRELTKIAVAEARGQIMQEIAPHFGVTESLAIEQMTRGMQADELKAFNDIVTEFKASPAQIASNPQLANLIRDSAERRADRARTPTLRGERPGMGTEEMVLEAEKEAWDKNFGDWGKFEDAKAFAEKKK